LQPLADGIREAFGEFSRQLQAFLLKLETEPSDVRLSAVDKDIRDASPVEAIDAKPMSRKHRRPRASLLISASCSMRDSIAS